MPICKDRRLLFIHIPKTAGSYIEIETNFVYTRKNVFTTERLVTYKNIPIQYQHLNYTLIVENNLIDKELLDSCYKFTFIRNPYTRLLSEYIFKYLDNFEFDPWLFNNFVDNYLKYPNFNDPEWMHLLPQKFYFDIEYNYVGKYENLQEDLQKIYKEIGYNKVLSSKKVNESNFDKNNLIDKIDKQTIEKINDYYWEDFELGKYEMI